MSSRWRCARSYASLLAGRLWILPIIIANPFVRPNSTPWEGAGDGDRVPPSYSKITLRRPGIRRPPNSANSWRTLVQVEAKLDSISSNWVQISPILARVGRFVAEVGGPCATLNQQILRAVCSSNFAVFSGRLSRGRRGEE